MFECCRKITFSEKREMVKERQEFDAEKEVIEKEPIVVEEKPIKEKLKRMKYFKPEDFDSPDRPGTGVLMDKDFLNKLDAMREVADIPFVITSGYRTKAHNKRVGGVNGSSHTKGLAVDIRCRSGKERHAVITAALHVGFTRIGIASNFIHVDDDKEKPQDVIWTY